MIAGGLFPTVGATHTHSTLRLLFLLPWSSFIFCVLQAGKLDQTVTAQGSGGWSEWGGRGGGRVSLLCVHLEAQPSDHLD